MPNGLPDHARESDSDYNGAFSYAGEWHAFSIGLAVGLTAVLPIPRAQKFVNSVLELEAETRSGALREARDESWYALGGMVVGILAGLVAYLYLLSLGGIL